MSTAPDDPALLFEAFFDPATATFTARAPDGAVDDDPACGPTGTARARRLLDRVAAPGATVPWIRETPPHADRLWAVQWRRDAGPGVVPDGRRRPLDVA